MNPLNYASIEASKRLVDNGIVLETDFYHETYGIDCYSIVPKETRDVYLRRVKRGRVSLFNYKWIPAPSMAEVWRELPEMFRMNVISIYKENGKTRIYPIPDFNILNNTNSTDALIDPLIWLRKEAT